MGPSLSRRQMLGLISGAAGGLALGTKPPGAYAARLGNLTVHAGVPAPSGLPVEREGEPDGRVRLGRRMVVARPRLASVANGNDRFHLEYRMAPPGSDEWPYLVHDGVAIAARWSGQTVGFELRRPRALAIAGALGIPLRERQPRGLGLRSSWRPASPIFRLGRPMRMIVRVEQHGEAEGFWLGGHQRGGRDNAFSFVAVPEGGSVLPVLDVPDFGGPSGPHTLRAGDEIELGADLRAWCALSRPGVYDVACRFATVLSPPDRDLDLAAEAWDWESAQVVRILVQA